MNILLVDDDISFVSVLSDFLKQKHTLRIASNGLDALNIFKVNHYDVVITDISVPKINGIELLKAIREIDKDAHVIILTGQPGKDYELKAEQYGSYAFFTKPLDVKRFMETLIRIENEISCT